MSVHIESPYWVNWVLWHGVDRHRRTRRGFHGAVWDFVNRVRSLPAGSLTIDGGANAGAVTAAFAAQGLRVHSFEPDPFARDQLQRRFVGNPLVTIHPEALGVRAGSATLFRRPDFDLQPERASKSSTLLPDMLPLAARPSPSTSSIWLRSSAGSTSRWRSCRSTSKAPRWKSSIG